MKGPLKTEVRVGQSYVDDPVVVYPEISKGLGVRQAVAGCFGSVNAIPKPLVVGHERVRLRWMRPDGKGGLVPKGK